MGVSVPKKALVAASAVVATTASTMLPKSSAPSCVDARDSSAAMRLRSGDTLHIGDQSAGIRRNGGRWQGEGGWASEEQQQNMMPAPRGGGCRIKGNNIAPIPQMV
jgi:hypothetical protein